VKSPFSKIKNRYQSPGTRRTLKLNDKAKLIVGIPLLLQLSLILALLTLMHDAETKQFQQMRANAIIFESGNLQRAVHDAGIAIGGYSITKNAFYGQRSEKIVASIPLELDKLRELVRGNYRQERAFGELERSTRVGLDMLKRAHSSIKDSSQAIGVRRVRDLYNELKDVTADMGNAIDSITNESRAVQTASAEQYERSKWAVRFFMFLSLGGSILIAFAFLSYFNSAITRRLSVVADNVARALRNEQLGRPLAGTDEIAQLDQTVRAMSNQMPFLPPSEIDVEERLSDDTTGSGQTTDKISLSEDLKKANS
jgi:CHASE3 domain sensor protein